MDNNQILDIPGNILTSENAQKILTYVKSIKEKGVKYLNEGKMLVLGHGRVGKSSLIKSLLYIATGDDEYRFDAKEHETIGIVRQEYLCGIEREAKKLQIYTCCMGFRRTGSAALHP